MISMGKSGGVYGSGNTGLPQAFSGGKKTQNNQKSIFGAKIKVLLPIFVECCPETVKVRRRRQRTVGDRIPSLQVP